MTSTNTRTAVPGRHRRPRRGHAPQPPPATPPTEDLTPPPWQRGPGLRVVPDPEPTEPVELVPPDLEVQMIYPGGERLRVPIRDGMVISLTAINGQPRIGVNMTRMGLA